MVFICGATLEQRNTNHRKCIPKDVAREFCTGKCPSLEIKLRLKKKGDKETYVRG
jgi:hypothetical protein